MRLINDQREIQRIFSNINYHDMPSWNDHPLFGELYRHSEPHVEPTGPAYLPCHLAVLEGQAPIALVAATLRQLKISHYGFPLRIALRQNLSSKDLNRAVGMIVEGLKSAVSPHSARALILGGVWGEPLSNLDNEMLKRMARPSMRTHAISELGSEPIDIQKHIRKSYRSLINWGKRNLEMKYVSFNNLNAELFSKFPEFHSQITGKRYYDNPFWDALWNSIARGSGELSLSYLGKNELAGCVFVADAGKVSYYSMGIFNRKLFDKPLSHFPVYDAIMRARSRGIKVFDLGEVPVKVDGLNDKAVQIGFFKRGFASNFNRFTLWELDL